MRIAICEDDPSDREKLKSYIDSYCHRHCYHGEVSLFGSGEYLLKAFFPGAFDLLFLDIYLPGISGMKTARQIRESDRDCLLVFITNSENHSMEGFLVQASGYVVKPLKAEQMDSTLHMCRQAFERNSRMITVPLAGEKRSLPLANLLYVEVIDKNSIFHMKNGTLTVRLPLDEIEVKLGGEPFLRCHRSYIVNMNHVAGLSDPDLLLDNGDTVPIRKNGRKEVKMAIAGFIAGMPLGAASQPNPEF